MSRKVFTCFIVISLFLNKAASYGQEFKCRVTPSRFPFRKEILRLITKEALPQSLWIYGKRLIFLPAVARPG